MIGSSAPNGSSISITGGSAASARARPTRWRCAAGELRGVARRGSRAPEADELEQLVARARGCRAFASRAAAARSRCCPRPSCAGRGRPAGSRSRSRAAARSGPARGRCGRRCGCRPSVSSIEPVDELHRRRLAAARRADEAADLAGGDRQRQVVDRGRWRGRGTAWSRGRRRSRPPDAEPSPRRD